MKGRRHSKVLILAFHLVLEIQTGWRDGPAIKSACCSSRRSKFGPHIRQLTATYSCSSGKPDTLFHLVLYTSDQLAHRLQGILLPFPIISLQDAGVADVYTPAPDFVLGSGDLNSSLYICAVSTFLTKQFSLPCGFHLRNTNSISEMPTFIDSH